MKKVTVNVAFIALSTIVALSFGLEESMARPGYGAGGVGTPAGGVGR